jgi:hypothetical protein
MALSLFGLWSSSNFKALKVPERSIATDCQSMVSEIIGPIAQEERILRAIAANAHTEKLFKLKNTIWNKVMGPHDFEAFNDQEYFRWMEIYKDGNDEFSNINPVSIEQKMALIEVINMRLIQTKLYNEKGLTEEAQKLNLFKLRKLQSHFKYMNLDSKLTRNDLNGFAADLMIILKGPPITLMDYFTKNKTARMNTRLMRMVQEDVLLMGLKGMIERIPEKDAYTRLENGKYIVKRFFQHKIWKYLAVPYDLPWFERVNIPDELLEKIMIDGLEAHDQELIEHLKKQNMIDHYERFRKVYKPIAFSIGFYFYFDKYNSEENSKINESVEDDKIQFIEFFKDISNKVLEGAIAEEKTEADLKQEQLERMIQTYKTKYNEAPTPKLIEEMRAKIYQ